MDLQKVLGLLKPKAVSFGFTEEELKSAGEFLSGILPDDATDEVIEQKLEQFVPVLKLSQSASNRAFERMKAQFEKEHPTKKETKEEEVVPPQAPEKEEKPAEDGVPSWFVKYQEQQEKKFKEQQKALETIKVERLQADLHSKAIDGLKGVDESFYGMLLNGKTFKDTEEVDSFVNEVKTSYDSFAQKVGIKTLAQMTPPIGGQEAPAEASQAVKDRVAKRKESLKNAPSAISGLGD